jgi:hypothetical protein
LFSPKYFLTGLLVAGLAALFLAMPLQGTSSAENLDVLDNVDGRRPVQRGARILCVETQARSDPAILALFRLVTLLHHPGGRLERKDR